MDPVDRHPYPPDVSFDGGDLDCGSGLLLLIRRHIDPIARGQLLEIRSTEPSVEEDLPAWCRLTGNELISFTRVGGARSFLVCKGALDAASGAGMRRAERGPGEARRGGSAAPGPHPLSRSAGAPPPLPTASAEPLPPLPAVPPIPPLAVMGIGSWPRPVWMMRAIHARLEGRLPEDEFRATADDAVRLAAEAQRRAGIDVLTDGEQRRDGYASFVGGLLDNCQLIPITDLLPYVDDPEKFERELRALDVPAASVRHPAVFGPLGRSRPLAVHEIEFLRGLTDRPVKVALPGPYLLTRTMWLECISDRAYATRERLADDVVRVLREETLALLAAGAAIVQLDEPVLTEVVFSGGRSTRSFMCGALSERGEQAAELAFAGDLIDRVVAGLPESRTALHVCRGNWTRDERVALAGDYRPLLPLLARVRVGTLFLELCTPRAGEIEVLAGLPDDRRVGVGVVNQKHERVESPEEVAARAEAAIRLFGADRVLLTPDCGFATFADNPVSSAPVAEAKLAAIARAAAALRKAHRAA